MVVASVKMSISSEKWDKVLEVIRAILEPTRVQPDCLSCRMYQDVNDEDVLIYEEIWQSQEALDRHIRSESYEHILAAMDLARDPPKIHFNTIMHSGGVEVIYAARQVEHASAS